MSNIKLSKEQWVVKDGSIWTAAEHEIQLSKYVRVSARQLVSPNMGELAHYIVQLHNDVLQLSRNYEQLQRAVDVS